MMSPYTIERRADTGVTNVTLGMWLFIASEVMLFGALFSAYALLRVSATAWPSGGDVLNLTLGAANTAVLIGTTACVWRARAASPASARRWLFVSSMWGFLFLLIKSLEYKAELKTGLTPASSTFLAMYFTLTGLHALHVIAGIVANLWAGAGALRIAPELLRGRVQSITLYWTFVDIVWLMIFGLMYLS
jgi:heme/copper-type cytochrome/quinol oxidase subunit 3